MPAISSSGPPPAPQPPFDPSGLPDVPKAIVFQHMDARGMATALGDRTWCAAILPQDFYRAARQLVARYEHEPLGSWPSLAEWEVLADEAHALRDENPHVKLLSNLWRGTRRLASRAVTSAHVEYGVRFEGLELYIGASRLVRVAGQAPQLIATRERAEGTRLLSADAHLDEPDVLHGVQFVPEQVSFRCEAIDSAPTGEQPRQWVVANHEDGSCSLYDPANTSVQPLPRDFALCSFAAVSANGRYVAARPEGAAFVLLHDRVADRTVVLQCPPRSAGQQAIPTQLSVDSDGVVFVADRRRGLELAVGAEPRIVDLDAEFTNFRLGPGERHLITNDATETNLRLQDRVVTDRALLLQHPGADDDALERHRILAITYSPGLAWAATTCEDGTLSVYNLVGAEHVGVLEPAVHVHLDLPPSCTDLQNAAPWFDPDGSAVNVAYTGSLLDANLVPDIRLMRLPLV